LPNPHNPDPAVQYSHSIPVPTRAALRREFDAAVTQLDQRRDKLMLTGDFYRQIGDAVFDAGYEALQDFVIHYTVPHRLLGGGDRDRMHVVSAPVGSGKTSFSVAFVAALVRYAEAHPTEAPHGAVVVVNQIKKADETFRDLNALLPGKVAIWTSDHDSRHPQGEQVTEPAAMFAREQLQDYPVAVVTQAFYKGKTADKAREVMLNGRLQPRALTVIDEQIEDVLVYQVLLSEAEKVREIVWADPQQSGLIGGGSATAGHYMDTLIQFMREHSGHGPSIERSTTEWDALRKQLRWFTTEPALDYVSHHKDDLAISAVFGFARGLARGWAFIARPNNHTAIYTGYENVFSPEPGTLQLDATADVDGITQLCPWRIDHPVPKADYSRLRVVSVPSILPPRQQLANYLKQGRANKLAYAAWMIEVIRAHMEPGQRGLVICKKALIEDYAIPNWSDDDPRRKDRATFTTGYGWDIDEGRTDIDDSQHRRLCVSPWGPGIGWNAWQDAEIVFLFDEFYLPRRVSIATAQGLQGYDGSHGPLAKLKGYNSRNAEIDGLWEGNLLRHQRQMTLRGAGPSVR
jgi:hypothetical protein